MIDSVTVQQWVNQQATVHIQYLNHQDKIEWRTIRCYSLRHGSSDWYPEPQQLLQAWCYTRQAEREFALNRILSSRSDLVEVTETS